MYSKEEQLRNNTKGKKVGTFGKKSKGLVSKPKKMNKVSDKKRTTSLEKRFLQYMKDGNFPCAICGEYDMNENHHLRFDETDRLHTSSGSRSHFRLLPVCRKHHYSSEASFHGNKYGLAKIISKEELLARSFSYLLKFEDETGTKIDCALLNRS